MSRKIHDENMPVGKLSRVDDLLPRPEDLVMPDDTVKVTIFLSRSSVSFFKREAGKYHTKYQKMIRGLLDHYVSCYRAA